jgi:hypothetical protein
MFVEGSSLRQALHAWRPEFSGRLLYESRPGRCNKKTGGEVANPHARFSQYQSGKLAT